MDKNTEMKTDKILGIGVVGNFAGHLSQAGEAKDFAEIHTDTEAPKGIFPFYVPNDKQHPLGRYCINNDQIILPSDPFLNVQAEPELALECDLIYDSHHHITEVIPKFFMAFNDASVRNDKNATKLSQKKNFSSGSKAHGIKIPLDNFSYGGICDSYSLVSFVGFNDQLELYGKLSKLIDYSYFHEKLIDWLKDRLNHQKEMTTLEDFSEILQMSHYPEKILVAIGATCYTELGETRFLQEKDEVFIVVFNHNKYSLNEVKEMLKNKTIPLQGNNDFSIVHQKVIRG